MKQVRLGRDHRVFWLVAGLVTTTSGCLPHRTVKRPAPPVPLPASFGDVDSKGTEGGEDGSPWWVSLNDPDLAQLVETALTDSFQFRIAFARLEQAEAIALSAGASLWPQLNFQARAGRQKTVTRALGMKVDQEFNSFSLSLPASYEVDLFGRLNAQEAAATLDAQASRLDVEAAAMSLTAQIADTWYNLVTTRARKAVLTQQLEINDMFMELVELRFQSGQASALDVLQQRQQREGTLAQLALVESQIGVAMNQLAALLGHAPGELTLPETETLVDLGPLPEAGVPAALLKSRPDIRSAQLRVAAADQRVGAAIASRFPSIRLTASIDTNATDVGDLFKDLLWSVFAQLTQPLFDGGTRTAEIRRAEAQLKERFESYGDVVVTAVTEVQNALLQERQQHLYIERLQSQLDIANAALDEARNRYRQGLTDFLPVLTSLTSQQQLELNLLEAKRQLLSHRIRLHRALGGTWTNGLQAPPARPELRELTEDDNSAKANPS